jgi:hypothetical protein
MTDFWNARYFGEGFIHIMAPNDFYWWRDIGYILQLK